MSPELLALRCRGVTRLKHALLALHQPRHRHRALLLPRARRRQLRSAGQGCVSRVSIASAQRCGVNAQSAHLRHASLEAVQLHAGRHSRLQLSLNAQN
jgi:hypothetical protein